MHNECLTLSLSLSLRGPKEFPYAQQMHYLPSDRALFTLRSEGITNINAIMVGRAGETPQKPEVQADKAGAHASTLNRIQQRLLTQGQVAQAWR